MRICVTNEPSQRVHLPGNADTCGAMCVYLWLSNPFAGLRNAYLYTHDTLFGNTCAQHRETWTNVRECAQVRTRALCVRKQFAGRAALVHVGVSSLTQ